MPATLASVRFSTGTDKNEIGIRERREIVSTIFKELEDAIVGTSVFSSGDAVHDGNSSGTIGDHVKSV